MIPTPPVVGFDLDMTLVDSAAGITATFAAAAGSVPGGASAAVAAGDVWPYIGVPLDRMAAALAPDADPDVLVARYRELYPEVGVPTTTLLPGALDALRAVREAGGRILLISAKAQRGVDAVLATVGLGTGDLAPDLAVGGLFAEAKGRLLVQEGATVYVGDHPGDVTAARSAGAVSVAVTSGPTPARDLWEAGADVVLDDLRDFALWLKGLTAGRRDPAGLTWAVRKHRGNRQVSRGQTCRLAR